MRIHNTTAEVMELSLHICMPGLPIQGTFGDRATCVGRNTSPTVGDIWRLLRYCYDLSIHRKLCEKPRPDAHDERKQICLSQFFMEGDDPIHALHEIKTRMTGALELRTIGLPLTEVPDTGRRGIQ